MEEKDFQESKGKQLSLAVEASGEHPHPDPQGESAEVRSVTLYILGKIKFKFCYGIHTNMLSFNKVKRSQTT